MTSTEAPGAPPAEEPEEPGNNDFEVAESAYVDGDRSFSPGTARTAFSHRTFRIIYLGAFASNIGTWMQNVVLGALAYELTHSGTFVGLVIAAQLGPLLLFSMVGGIIADSFDRKKSLMVLSVQQAVFSLLLAVVAIPANPSKVLLVAVVFAIGVGNALYAPIFSALVPILVPRRDMTGAIALNSVQMNASRVIGPAIGSLIFSTFGAPWVFVINAVSFGFVILSLTRVTLPDPLATGAQGWHRLVEGFQAARGDRVVGQCLVVIAIFSFLCLPFITQLPLIADLHLHINAKSTTYGILYACFGMGAVIGALSIGTVFASSSKAKLTRRGLIGFAVMLTAFGALRASAPAFLVIMVLGGVYFAVITSLSTVLQEQVDDAVRGKVMALWIMGFGGTVPFGGLLGGILMEQFGILAVLIGGSVVAVLLAWWADLLPVAPPRRSGFALLDRSR
jgi:MFS family permease